MRSRDFEVMLYGENGGHIGTYVVTGANEARSAIKRVLRVHGKVGKLQTLEYRGRFERWEKWRAWGTKRIISTQARMIGPENQP